MNKPLTVTLTPVNCYSIRLGKEEILFRVVGEWNGMLELLDDKDRKLIVDRGCLSLPFELLSELLDGVPQDCNVIKGSGELIFLLIEAQQSGNPDPGNPGT